MSAVATARRRGRRLSRPLLIVLGALLLAGGGVTAWAMLHTPAAPAVSYRTVTVSPQTLQSTVSASGTINPAQQTTLTFQSPGTVTSVKVAVGDTVKEGQALAQVDTSALEISYQQAQATLAQDQAALDSLQADSTSTSAALASAEAAVAYDHSQVQSAQAAVDNGTLRASFAGQVAAMGLAKGDVISSSGSVSAGTVTLGADNNSGSSGGSSADGNSGSSGGSSADGNSGSSGGSSADGNSGSGSSNGAAGSSGTTTGSSGITVISKGSYTVTTSISTADVDSVTKGMQATIDSAGSSERAFGTVSSVGVMAAASSDGGAATFPVTIAVTGHPSLLAGASADVSIVVKQLADAIAVPTQAVKTVDGAPSVTRMVSGKQVATPVTLGEVLGAQTVVTKGLASGDEVVIASDEAPDQLINPPGSARSGGGSGGGRQNGTGGNGTGGNGTGGNGTGGNSTGGNSTGGQRGTN